MADLKAELRWSGAALQFTGGREGGPEVAIDGDGATGPSPVAALLLAIGGCMGADIIDIGAKMRVPVTGLRVLVECDRRAEPPRRLLAVRMRFIVDGVDPAEEHKVQRAVDLSRETYCSVLHSLREDITVDIDVQLRRKEAT